MPLIYKNGTMTFAEWDSILQSLNFCARKSNRRGLHKKQLAEGGMLLHNKENERGRLL